MTRDRMVPEERRAHAQEEEEPLPAASPPPASEEEMTPTFEDLGLAPNLVRALHEIGWTTPTPIQARSIPLLLQDRDMIGQAKTGTGKTGAFGLPILQKLDTTGKELQAIILTPTRELAVQVADEFERIGKHTGVRVVTIYGGAAFGPQLDGIRRGAHVCVGTPGRVIDLMKRGSLKLTHVKACVLDEADRMLDMGFIEDVEWILERLPPGRKQMMLFSATMPPEIRELAERWLTDPATVKFRSATLTVPQVEQIYYDVGRRNKLWALSRVLDAENPPRTLVFCSTKRMVDKLAEELRHIGYKAEGLHGDMRQGRREKVLEEFRAAEVTILVATDVAARGLDIEGITHVVNYDLPEEAEVYVHRIGRTARAGKSGKAISLVTKFDRNLLRQVEDVVGSRIELREPPGVASEAGRRGTERVRQVIDWDHIADRYGNVHIQVNIGQRDGATMVSVHRLVMNASGIADYLIGNIRVSDDHALFDVPKDNAQRVKQALERTQFKGKRLRADFVPQEE